MSIDSQPCHALWVRAHGDQFFLCPNRDKVRKTRSREFCAPWTNFEATDEFRPTQREFCPTPGAKFGQHRPTPTYQPPMSKRLARARWGETRRISPHDKKKKFFVGAEFISLS
jgi:hypothetical protein